ncbi:MAG: c-type cytochrome [Gemmatimonadaceae bacterium]|nr:c-type cytochrome [Gemmatimonadaceae bacterium]
MRMSSSLSRTMIVIMLLSSGACRDQRATSGAATADSSATPATSTTATTATNTLVISRHDDRVFAGGIAPPAEKFTNEAASDAKAADAGATLFTGMNCDGCHGGGAVGAVGPSLTDGRWRYGGADVDIYRSIAEGRPKGMPAFGGVLQPAMIWRLVVYIKSLPLPNDVSTESWQ